jgi:hypothetical protein
MVWSHSIRASLATVLAAAVLASLAAQTPASPPVPVSFAVFFRSARIGTEEVVVDRTAEGWTISSKGAVGVPIEITTRRLTLRYDANWQPRELNVDATQRGQLTLMRTLVAGGTATSTITTGDAAAERTHAVPDDAVMLPGGFFAPYEALAARLKDAAAGSTFTVYIAPQGSVTATVGESASEVFDRSGGVLRARRTRLTMAGPGLPPIETIVWGDESGRLLRVSVPAQALEVLREDLASVSARRVAVPRAGDETVRVPGNGFVLAATVSKPPVATAARLPAVVLAGGADLVDRDETVAGVPVFGQLAGDLADAGFLVLRYDRRGVGQSGGRPESSTLDEYVEDLRAAVRLVHDRRDVDRNRVAVLGYADGGQVAMLAADRDDRVRALVLVAASGVSGAETTLAQLTATLARANRPEAERQSTLALQRQIQAAVVTGKGWETVPTELRRQADIPWFRSYLAFDPARVLRNTHQPVLVVHGEADWQIAPSNADRLGEIARARGRTVPVDVVKLPGLDRTLAPPGTGGTERRVSPVVARTIATWLDTALPASRR